VANIVSFRGVSTIVALHALFVFQFPLGQSGVHVVSLALHPRFFFFNRTFKRSTVLVLIQLFHPLFLIEIDGSSIYSPIVGSLKWL
jgi:hypothetical protein